MSRNVVVSFAEGYSKVLDDKKIGGHMFFCSRFGGGGRGLYSKGDTRGGYTRDSTVVEIRPICVLICTCTESNDSKENCHSDFFYFYCSSMASDQNYARTKPNNTLLFRRSPAIWLEIFSSTIVAAQMTQAGCGCISFFHTATKKLHYKIKLQSFFKNLKNLHRKTSISGTPISGTVL